MASEFEQNHGLVLILAEWRRECADTVYQVCTAAELWLYKPEWGRIVRRGWWTVQLLEAEESEAAGEWLEWFLVAVVLQRVVVEIPGQVFEAMLGGEWLLAAV